MSYVGILYTSDIIFKCRYSTFTGKIEHVKVNTYNKAIESEFVNS